MAAAEMVAADTVATDGGGGVGEHAAEGPLTASAWLKLQEAAVEQAAVAEAAALQAAEQSGAVVLDVEVMEMEAASAEATEAAASASSTHRPRSRWRRFMGLGSGRGASSSCLSSSQPTASDTVPVEPRAIAAVMRIARGIASVRGDANVGLHNTHTNDVDGDGVADALNMDHVHMNFSDYLWVWYFVGVNAFYLWYASQQRRPQRWAHRPPHCPPHCRPQRRRHRPCDVVSRPRRCIGASPPHRTAASPHHRPAPSHCSAAPPHPRPHRRTPTHPAPFRVRATVHRASGITKMLGRAWLMRKGVIKPRASMYLDGQARGQRVPYDPRRLVGKLCLEGLQVVRYDGKEAAPEGGSHAGPSKTDEIAYFRWHQLPYLTKENTFARANLLEVQIALPSKLMHAATLDGEPLTPNQARTSLTTTRHTLALLIPPTNHPTHTRPARRPPPTAPVERSVARRPSS
jgi:hypothetical protein